MCQCSEIKYSIFNLLYRFCINNKFINTNKNEIIYFQIQTKKKNFFKNKRFLLSVFLNTLKYYHYQKSSRLIKKVLKPFRFKSTI